MSNVSMSSLSGETLFSGDPCTEILDKSALLLSELSLLFELLSLFVEFSIEVWLFTIFSSVMLEMLLLTYLKA
jgi:hypothetical protein